MKRMLALFMAVAMCFGMMACGSTTTDKDSTDTGSQTTTDTADTGSEETSDTETGSDTTDLGFKIGIMTSTVSQAEEEYRAAENMVAQYGEDQIIHLTFPDKATSEQETTISLAMSLAADPEVKAIVFNTAMEGTAAAMEKVRESRPDILLLAGVPSEAPEVITAAADMVIHPDVANMGAQVADAAAEMGATTVVHYSFSRHMAQPLNIARRDSMKARCEELGLTFVEGTTPDPMSDAGVSATQQFILEDVPRMVAEYGPDTAFFGTNAGQQEPLCKAIYEAGAIYPLPDNPSVFYAFPGALGIEVPEEEKGNVSYMQEAISAKLAEGGMEGRMGCWSVPMHTMFISCLVEYAIEYVNGDITERADMDAMYRIMEEFAGGEVSLRTYTDINSNVTYDNFFVFLGNFVTL